MIIDMPRLKNIVCSLINRYFNVGAISREISKEKFYLRKTQLEDKILNCVNPGVSKRKYCPHVYRRFRNESHGFTNRMGGCFPI